MKYFENSRSLKPSFITLPEQKNRNTTILDYLKLRFPHIGRDVWSARINNGLVFLPDGGTVTLRTPYRTGLRISYFRESPKEIRVPFRVRFLFHNDHIAAVCKPHFLPVQPAGPFVRECLLNRMIKSLGNKDLTPLHRIDRETAGVVLFSLNRKTRDIYHRLFRSGKIRKIYEAIGTRPKNDNLTRWLIENRIVESEQWPGMINSSGPVNAKTLIEKTDQRGDLVKFRIEPFTGKGHQIRLHLQLIGSGILNDRYHPELQPRQYDNFQNPLQLVARELEFDDPITGSRFKFTSARKLLF